MQRSICRERRDEIGKKTKRNFEGLDADDFIISRAAGSWFCLRAVLPVVGKCGDYRMRSNNRKYGSNTDSRDDAGKFAAGNSGKPRGARNRVTRAVEELFDGQAEEITQKAIELALAGELIALKMCMERIMPSRKDTPIQFNLQAMTSATEAAQTAQGVLQAVAYGLITPLEAKVVMGLVEQYRQALETSELEGRITALERAGEMVPK